MKKISLIVILIAFTFSIFAQKNSNSAKDEKTLENIKTGIETIKNLKLLIEFKKFKLDFEQSTVSLGQKFTQEGNMEKYNELRSKYNQTKQLYDGFLGMIAKDLSDFKSYQEFAKDPEGRTKAYNDEFTRIRTKYEKEIQPFYRENQTEKSGVIIALVVDYVGVPLVKFLVSYVKDNIIKPYLSNQILKVVNEKFLSPLQFKEWEVQEKEVGQQAVSLVPIRGEIKGSIEFNYLSNIKNKTEEGIKFEKEQDIFVSTKNYPTPKKTWFRIKVENPSLCYVFGINAQQELYRIYPFTDEWREGYKMKSKSGIGGLPETEDNTITIPGLDSLGKENYIYTEFKEEYFFILLSKSQINLEKDVFPRLDSRNPEAILPKLKELFSGQTPQNEDVEIKSGGKMLFGEGKYSENTVVVPLAYKIKGQ